MNVFLVVTSLHIFQIKFCRYTLPSSVYMICVIYLSFLEVIMHLTIEAQMESIWSQIQQWLFCLVVGLWVKRQAGKRGSTAHELPSILCLFGKHLQWLKLQIFYSPKTSACDPPSMTGTKFKTHIKHGQLKVCIFRQHTRLWTAWLQGFL